MKTPQAEPAGASSFQGGDAIRLGPLEIGILVLVVIGLIVVVRTFAGRAGRR
jgi:hypothetical protein